MALKAIFVRIGG